MNTVIYPGLNLKFCLSFDVPYVKKSKYIIFENWNVLKKSLQVHFQLNSIGGLTELFDEITMPYAIDHRRNRKCTYDEVFMARCSSK